jgi:ribulose-5-phosphate 4-epimerase/fuculose-1-phosphate aldolase
MNRDEENLAALRRDVALACRILAHRGLSDGILGHVSARVDDGHMLVRCRSPRERGLLFTTPEDIQLVDLDGKGDLGDYSPPNELPIHTALLRSRPHAGAVVHVHPPAIVALDLAGHALKPVVGAFNIPAAAMARQGIPVYPRGVLINDQSLADDMLSSMREEPAVVLRAHGLVTTGSTVAEAVVRAVDLDTLARLSLAVLHAGGELHDLPKDDLDSLPDLGSSFNNDLNWQYLTALLQEAGLGLA